MMPIGSAIKTVDDRLFEAAATIKVFEEVVKSIQALEARINKLEERINKPAPMEEWR